jgi:DNA-directed RNA polymerase specialized sigma24 family protein
LISIFLKRWQGPPFFMQTPQSEFPHTRWTLLLTLREGSPEKSKDALEALCRAYWFPLYVVARKRLSEFDAEDAVQGFFLSLLRRDALTQVDESRGRLRTFLLTAFENFCNQQWERQNTQKRGGEIEHIQLFTVHGAESRYIKHAEASTDDVETLYNREWARTVLEGSLEALSQDYAERGQKARFDLLAAHLTQEDPEISMAQSALSAGMTAEAYRTALHRLRQQYRGKIESELARTLDTRDAGVIREELHELFRAFS